MSSTIQEFENKSLFFSFFVCLFGATSNGAQELTPDFCSGIPEQRPLIVVFEDHMGYHGPGESHASRHSMLCAIPPGPRKACFLPFYLLLCS